MAFTPDHVKNVSILTAIIGVAGFWCATARSIGNAHDVMGAYGWDDNFFKYDPLISSGFEDPAALILLGIASLMATSGLIYGSVSMCIAMEDKKYGTRTPATILMSSCAVFFAAAIYILVNADDMPGRTATGSLMICSGIYAGTLAFAGHNAAGNKNTHRS